MHTMNYNRIFGNEGELKVVEYLKAQHYIILQTQFSLNQKIGEIDIIAKKENILIFVEVKRRRKDYDILVSELVPYRKQKRIIMMSKYFCQKEKILFSDHIIRYDIAFVLENKVLYYENAFTE